MFVVQDDDVTEIMKIVRIRARCNRLTYDVPPVLSKIKTFDGVPVKVILNDAERHDEKETSDWKQQMQYGIQREMFKQKQGDCWSSCKDAVSIGDDQRVGHLNRSAPSRWP